MQINLNTNIANDDFGAKDANNRGFGGRSKSIFVGRNGNASNNNS